MIVTPPTAGATAATATAGVSNVILTSTSDFTMSSADHDIATPAGHLGLLTIEQALEQEGFERISLFAREETASLDLIENWKEIVLRFYRQGANEKGAVIGISTTTDEYHRFPLLANMLRAGFPDALLIAGGVHFAADKRNGGFNTVKQVLHEGLVDAVNVGHARPFVDLITKHGGRIEEVEAPGLYRLDGASDDVVGRGSGRLVHLDSVPYFMRNDGEFLITMFSDICRQGCDFCAMRRGTSPMFSEDVVVESMKAAIASNDPWCLGLQDSDPLAEYNIDYYLRIFEALDAVNPLEKHIPLNPSHLVSSDHRGRVLEAVRKHRISEFLIGRDAVDEETGRCIGTRYLGELKDQDQLDKEGNALREFVRELSAEGSGLQRVFHVSYIVTPFQTRENFYNVFRDMTGLNGAASGDVSIAVRMFPLMPYPGTKLYKRMRSHIESGAFDYGAVRDGTIVPWKRDAGPAIPVMIALDSGVVEKDDGSEMARIKDEVDRVFPASWID